MALSVPASVPGASLCAISALQGDVTTVPLATLRLSFALDHLCVGAAHVGFSPVGSQHNQVSMLLAPCSLEALLSVSRVYL